jgi:hypothetical protein
VLPNAPAIVPPSVRLTCPVRGVDEARISEHAVVTDPRGGLGDEHRAADAEVILGHHRLGHACAGEDCVTAVQVVAGEHG